MAKFKCVGGAAITTAGAIPNPNEWRMISNVDFDAFTGLSSQRTSIGRRRSCIDVPSAIISGSTDEASTSHRRSTLPKCSDGRM